MFANANAMIESTASGAWTLKKRPLEIRDLPYLVSLDHEVYPTLENMSNGPNASNEALFRRLFFEQELNDAQGKRHRVSTHAPELSFVLECVPVSPGSPGAINGPLPRNSIAAMCIILPLNRQGFYKLTHNICFEYDLDPVHDLFHAERKELGNDASMAMGDKELGFHVFLIDKFVTQGVGSLYKLSLEHLAEQVNKMRSALYPQLSIVGLSGYTVSYEGVSLFFNKLNCIERPQCFLSQEHVFTKDIKTAEGTKKTAKMVCRVRDDQHLRELCLRDNWSYGNRCKMLVTYPGDVSIVWLTIPANPECFMKQECAEEVIPQAASPISIRSPATLAELMNQAMNQSVQEQCCCPHCGFVLPVPSTGLSAAGASLPEDIIPTITTTAAAPTPFQNSVTTIVLKPPRSPAAVAPRLSDPPKLGHKAPAPGFHHLSHQRTANTTTTTVSTIPSNIPKVPSLARIPSTSALSDC